MEIGKYFPLKPAPVSLPKTYLGAKVTMVQLLNGVDAYAVSMSQQYIQEAVKNVKGHLKKRNLALPKKALMPMMANYSPELDASDELDTEDATYYQSLIGILRWIVEMGRVDICMEASALSPFVAMPREGHMQQVLHIFSYLKIHHNVRVVFDPTYLDINMEMLLKHEWSSIYGSDKEDVPGNAPKPMGHKFIIRVYVDALFAGCKVTRRSRTGFIVYLNRAPIYFMS